jgi:hypothetical protein
MDCSVLRERLSSSVGNHFQCEVLEDGLLALQTPFSYPNGDMIELYLRDNGDYVVVTDYGETLRYLASMNVSVDTGKRKQQFESFLRSGRVEEMQGLLLRHASQDNFIDSVYRLCETIVRISDITISSRIRTTEAFRSIISNATYELLPRESIREDVTVEGDSGEVYEIDFVVFSQSITASQKYILTLSGRSVSAADDAHEEAVSIWDDLVSISPQRRISILDNRDHLWKPTWIKHLRRHSNVVIWQNESSAAEYAATLAA